MRRRSALQLTTLQLNFFKSIFHNYKHVFGNIFYAPWLGTLHYNFTTLKPNLFKSIFHYIITRLQARIRKFIFMRFMAEGDHNYNFTTLQPYLSYKYES